MFLLSFLGVMAALLGSAAMMMHRLDTLSALANKRPAATALHIHHAVKEWGLLYKQHYVDNRQCRTTELDDEEQPVEVDTPYVGVAGVCANGGELLEPEAPESLALLDFAFAAAPLSGVTTEYVRLTDDYGAACFVFNTNALRGLENLRSAVATGYMKNFVSETTGSALILRGNTTCAWSLDDPFASDVTPAGLAQAGQGSVLVPLAKADFR